MMAAAQPFISGAISKTINLPNEASVDDIAACYRLSWELGLKANALYRDGCKLSQPLSATADEAKKEVGADKAGPDLEPSSSAKEGPDSRVHSVAAPAETPAAKPDAEGPHKPRRRRLPDTRRSVTHKFNVAGHEGYLTVGLYDDGQPGEIFITMSKEGSTIGGLMDSLGTSTSVALQYGVPIKSLVDKFSHQRFEPAGMTENSDIPFAKSLVDYIFRWMGMQFIPGYREAHSPRRDHHEPERPLADRMVISEPKPQGVVHLHAERITEVELVVQARGNALDASMGQAQADAPACDVCGTITVRSGVCYKCLNCGNSMGCS
jgi:ribonucleoside-diphosphate reductase alpha chain